MLCCTFLPLSAPILFGQPVGQVIITLFLGAAVVKGQGLPFPPDSTPHYCDPMAGGSWGHPKQTSTQQQ